MIPTLAGVHHLKLPVADLDRSIAPLIVDDAVASARAKEDGWHAGQAASTGEKGGAP